MRISNRLSQHLAVAATTAAGIAASSNAAVVAWENCNLVIPATFSGLYINVEDRTTGGSTSLAGWDINPYGTSSLTFYHPSGGGYVVATGQTGAANLAIGSVVGASSTFGGNFASASFGTGATQWKLNETNTFGFRFVNSLGQTRYAYATMSVGATAATRTITNIYYEDSGAGITVVPAPGAIALLGLAGFAGRRRR